MRGQRRPHGAEVVVSSCCDFGRCISSVRSLLFAFLEYIGLGRRTSECAKEYRYECDDANQRNGTLNLKWVTAEWNGDHVLNGGNKEWPEEDAALHAFNLVRILLWSQMTIMCLLICVDPPPPIHSSVSCWETVFEIYLRLYQCLHK